MNIFKRDLFEILNGNQHLIEEYKAKYFPEDTHSFICEQCGKRFFAYTKVKRKYCSPECNSKHFRLNSDKEYEREYKKMYARMRAGKISRDQFKSYMREFKIGRIND